MRHRILDYDEATGLPLPPDFPLLLHVHSVSPDGSPEWSRPFAKYLAKCEAIHEENAERLYFSWWRNAYVIRGLKRQFDVPTVDAVVRLQFLDMEQALDAGTTIYSIVGRQFRMTPEKLARRERQIKRHVRIHYLPKLAHYTGVLDNAA